MRKTESGFINALNVDSASAKKNYGLIQQEFKARREKLLKSMTPHVPDSTKPLTSTENLLRKRVEFKSKVLSHVETINKNLKGNRKVTSKDIVNQIAKLSKIKKAKIPNVDYVEGLSM